MVGFVFSLILIVVAVVGQIQIITKAGYSPWWILFPLSLPVLWFISIAVAFGGLSSSIGTYGVFNLQGVADQAAVLGTVTLLDLIANYVMFIIFAFSDWPVMQAARARHPQQPGPYPGGPGTYGPPAGRPPATSPFPGVGPPPPVATQVRPMGWHRVDESTDEQYWDGRSWTARRRPKGDGGWVIIPVSD
jgi:hypothetical protein